MNRDGVEKNTKEWDGICRDLVKLLKKQTKASSSEVQKIIHRHYEWLKEHWTPNRSSYTSLGEQYVGFEREMAFEPYNSEHPKLAQFLAEGMKIFAEKELF